MIQKTHPSIIFHKYILPLIMPLYALAHNEITGELITGKYLGSLTTTELTAHEQLKKLKTRNPQVVFGSFLGSSLVDTPGIFPPDTMGAVGPTQYIILTNQRIRSFSKATGLIDNVLNVDLDQFFNRVRTATTGDGRIRYDRLSGRWFVTAFTSEAVNNNIVIAVSNTATITPTTRWSFFIFTPSLAQPAGEANVFWDYPTLGIDNNALYIGTFPVGSTIGQSTAFVIPKAPLISDTPLLFVKAFRGINDGTSGNIILQGVDNFDPFATTGYFITSNDGVDALILHKVLNPGTNPTLADPISIPVPFAPNPDPLLVPSKNGQVGLDTVFARLMMAHIRKDPKTGTDRLWTAHNALLNSSGNGDMNGDRIGCRWYELDISTEIPTVVQFGTLFDSTPINPIFYWMPSLMTSGQGHMALGCSAAGVTHFIDAVTAGRLATDPLGITQSPTFYTHSTTAYNADGTQGNPPFQRWGDYSYTSLDPSDDMTMFTIQEYCADTDVWGIRVAKLLAPAPATPTAASPNIIGTGLDSVNIMITAQQVDGSGFYDPVNYPVPPQPNHIGAQISGGVSVNNVNVISPTQLILNISTMEAAPGPKNVTIINPDGQFITATNLLIVSA